MKRRLLRAILIIAILIPLAGITYKTVQTVWRAKANEIQKNPLKLLDYVPEAALQVKNFSRTKIAGGKKVWEVAGEEARFLKAENEALVKNPRVVFYDNNGEAIEASGNEARLFFADQEMEKMLLLGGIRVRYRDFVLQLDEIVYHKETHRVVSRGKVHLKGDGIELEGVGLEIALQDERLRLLTQVKTKLVPQLLEKRQTSGDGGQRKRL